MNEEVKLSGGTNGGGQRKRQGRTYAQYTIYTCLKISLCNTVPCFMNIYNEKNNSEWYNPKLLCATKIIYTNLFIVFTASKAK